jgi:hypothetical protein
MAQVAVYFLVQEVGEIKGSPQLGRDRFPVEPHGPQDARCAKTLTGLELPARELGDYRGDASLSGAGLTVACSPPQR